MYSVPFVIDETPYCLWDWELKRLEHEFLSGVDPEYFEYMAKTHAAGLDGDQPQRAALALRMTYSHAQETLMSLLCAIVQAPACVIGWLHKYKNAELESVVRKLHQHQPVLAKIDGEVSWQGLSNMVHRYVSCPDKEKESKIKESFGTFWSRTADDFLDHGGRREYNSIKHGLRARSGGFHLLAGIEMTPGVAGPPEQLKTVGGGEFGTTYYGVESVEGVEKCNVRAQSSSRNWLPDLLAGRTYLMSLSMGNILSFLKVAKGEDPQKHQFKWPEDLSAFEECWRYSPGVTAASFNVDLTSVNIKPMTKLEILGRYRRGDETAKGLVPDRGNVGNEVR
jgi:hypothetical protein